jgi:hypothetical protein
MLVAATNQDCGDSFDPLITALIAVERLPLDA